MSAIGGFLRGAATAGSGVGPLLVQGAAAIEPGDRAMVAWNFDPALAVASGAPTSGTITGGRVKHPGGTITNILSCTIAPGVNLVAGQCFLGIYDPVTGNRLALTASVDVQFATPAVQVIPLVAPLVALPAQFLDVVFLFNHAAGSTPAFCRVSGATGQFGAAPAGTPLRAFTADAGAIALPAVLGAKTIRATPEWLGLS